MNPDGSRQESAGLARSGRIGPVIRFYKTTAAILFTLLSAGLVTSFVAQLPYPRLKDLEPIVLLKIALVLYFYSYYLGSTRDLSVHSDILRDAPQPTAREVALILVLFVPFGLLLYVERPALVAVKSQGCWIIESAMRAVGSQTARFWG